MGFLNEFYAGLEVFGWAFVAFAETQVSEARPGAPSFLFIQFGATRQMWLSSITAEGDKVEVFGALVFLGCSRDFELSIKKADPSLCSG
jgi:hypothetical protein